MLLILTSDQDLAADYLIVELIKRNLPYFRLNSEELSRAKYTFALENASATRKIVVGPRSLDLSAVTAVWYRRSIHPTLETSLTPAERHFVTGELRHLAMGLVLNPEVVWVNPIDRVSVAEHKLYQLQMHGGIRASQRAHPGCRPRYCRRPAPRMPRWSPAPDARSGRSCRPAHKPHSVNETVTVHYRFYPALNPGKDARMPETLERVDIEHRVEESQRNVR